MKGLKVLALGIMLTLTAGAVKAEAITSDFVAEPFSTVNIGVPAAVTFVQGDGYSVSVQADDEEVAKGVICEVIDGQLYIYADVSLDSECAENNNITVTVSAPLLPSVFISPSCQTI